MTSTVHRSIGLATLVLLALLPLGRMACEVICAPGLDAVAHGDTTRSDGHAAACHEPVDPAALSLSGIQDHGCGDHAGGTAEAALWLKTGRFDASVRPVELHGSVAALVPPSAPQTIRPSPAGLPQGPPSHTHASIASVVLRI